MTLQELLKELKKFRETIIIGNKNEKLQIRKCYSSLSKIDFFLKRHEYVLCGDITELFLSKIRSLGHDGRPIFIWSRLIKNQKELVLDSNYIQAIVNSDFDLIQNYEDNIKFENTVASFFVIIEFYIIFIPESVLNSLP